ncbi:MAG: BolA/IbaG family iron-sulfur metabolism protein [Pseudomonadales bacterium]|nr:BolA/IbaG family iron-sulfur metabolism protein [Pseudomonadales bacterium]
MSVKDVIETKLKEAFQPSHLQVINESFRHSVPPGSESHFKVTLVSADFLGSTAVKRHQMVYQLLADELKNGIHALALHLYTDAEWREKGAVEPESPACRGGSK